MSSNNISLSQEEVDKLLGIVTEPGHFSAPEKKQYKTEHIVTERQKNEIRIVCLGLYLMLKQSLRERFGEPQTRKFDIKSVEEMCIDEFFDIATKKDFLYEITFSGAPCYAKADPFLFSVLSGIPFDIRQNTTAFQSEVLKEFVVRIFADSFAAKIKADAPEITSLFRQDNSRLCDGKTGLCITLSWNENASSFGIEKIFLTKKLIDYVYQDAGRTVQNAAS